MISILKLRGRFIVSGSKVARQVTRKPKIYCSRQRDHTTQDHVRLPRINRTRVRNVMLSGQPERQVPARRMSDRDHPIQI
jgi:hypothetical protein